MARVNFTSHIQRHVDCKACDVPGGTVREVLVAAFARNPRAGKYFLDERGRLRNHVVVFINGAAVKDRDGLTDSVPDDAEVFIMQALSGG